MDINKVIKENIKAREEEVAGYQLNIDNYTLAIELIDANDSDLVDFKRELELRLNAEKIEQKKSKIMLKVLEMRLAE